MFTAFASLRTEMPKGGSGTFKTSLERTTFTVADEGVLQWSLQEF